MFAAVLDWLSGKPVLGALFSIVMNIAVAITGVLPSAFITVGTIAFFDFQWGLFILVIGEAAGAIISFILYRKGISKLLSVFSKSSNKKNKFMQKLKEADGANAFFIVILLRILPFVPSGAVTLTAAFSKMGLLPFSIASTLGKIPALLIEAYSVSQVLTLKTEWQLGIIVLVAIIFLLYWIWERKR